MNDKDLVNKIMWGVACGIALERVFHSFGCLVTDVIQEKIAKKKEK